MVLRLKARKSRSPPDPQNPRSAAEPNPGPSPALLRPPIAPASPEAGRRGHTSLTRRQDLGKPGEALAKRHPGTKHDSRGPNTQTNAGWSSPVARQAHNLKVRGSNPLPATSVTC